MKLQKVSPAEFDRILSWSSDAEILGPYQRPFGWDAPSPAPNRDIYFITDTKEEIGFAYVHYTRLGLAEIGVTILPQFRGCGYGRWAHAALVGRAREQGAESVQALTDSRNAAETNILTRLGFVCVDRLIARVHQESPRTVLVFRRPLSTQQSADRSLVVFITGPPGSGKSTLSDQIKPLLARRNPERRIFFIWGDMFSHLSFPWQGSADQMSLKYDAMRQVLGNLLEPGAIVVVDDLFRRKQDVDDLRCFVLLRDARPLFIFLEAPLELVLTRNRIRYVREVLPDADLIKLFEANRAAIDSESPDIVAIKNASAIEEAAWSIVGIVEEYLK